MKVIIERSDCTSCGTCYDTCPEFFEEDPDDSFSRIVEKYRLNGDKSQGIPPADAEGCVVEAVDLCPVQIIRIEEE